MHDDSGLFVILTRSNEVKYSKIIYQGLEDMMYDEVIDKLAFDLVDLVLRIMIPECGDSINNY